MRNFKSIASLTLIVVLGCVINASAQGRPEKSSSARAYYGEAPNKPKFRKKKSKKVRDYTHTRPAKGTRTEARAWRKKNSRS